MSYDYLNGSFENSFAEFHSNVWKKIRTLQDLWCQKIRAILVHFGLLQALFFFIFSGPVGILL